QPGQDGPVEPSDGYLSVSGLKRGEQFRDAGLEAAQVALWVGFEDARSDQESTQMLSGFALGECIECVVADWEASAVEVLEQVLGAMQPAPGGQRFGAQKRLAQRAQCSCAFIGWQYPVELTSQRTGVANPFVVGADQRDVC